MSMQPRAIIEFNDSVERNAFLSKPTYLLLPSPYLLQRSNDKFTLHSPLPQHPISATNNYRKLPTLSASPASSISSSASGPLTLEDEEIKRIFSNDSMKSGMTPQLHSSVGSELARLPWADPITPPPRNVLNPSARSFVPTLDPIPDKITPSLPSPFGLGPGARSLVHPPPVRLPLPPPPTPGCPPGLPHPPLYKHLVGINVLNSGLPYIHDVQCAAASPAALVQRALNPKISEWHRDLTVNRIVTSSTWTVDSVIGLAEIICFESCQSSHDLGAIGQEVPVCPKERHWSTSMKGADLPSCYSESRAQVAAVLGRDLSRQLSAWCGEEVAQAFSGCLREKILQTFLRHWDNSIESSINYFPTPSTHRVRSALAVSVAVAALYTQDFILHVDISMCINVLLSSLKSVEHAEALANIVIGCGQRFWASTPAVAPDSSETLTHSMILKRHVGEFLFGLEVNCDVHRLSDDKSVVDRPWGEGQLMARLHEVANSVKAWEADLQLQIQQQTVAVAHHAG